MYPRHFNINPLAKNAFFVQSLGLKSDYYNFFTVYRKKDKNNLILIFPFKIQQELFFFKFILKFPPVISSSTTHWNALIIHSDSFKVKSIEKKKLQFKK